MKFARRVVFNLSLCLTLIACFSASTIVDAAEKEPTLLWPEGAPGAKGTEDADQPGLWIYSAPEDKRTGAGVVVCPGGGYGGLAVDTEGHQIAQFLNRNGISAFVLRYRLGRQYPHPIPMQDVQRAIRFVRKDAAKWGVDPQRIGVMGFSAGGHLASTAATHFDTGIRASSDSIDQISCRPDFAILCYPVITMSQDFGHKGSARNLLGESPDPELLKLMSNELQVTAETPPTFLFHTSDDKVVPPMNSVAFYQALNKAGVPAEMHIFRHGRHGVSLAPGYPALSVWPDLLLNWMKSSGFLTDAKRSAVEGTITVDGSPLRWGTITFKPVGEHTENKPAVCGRVLNGKFSIPEAYGPVQGTNSIEVINMGDFKPFPTQDDFKRVTQTGQIKFNIFSGKNDLALDLKSK
ncbi:alpha/beta hydrolase [Gimesia algae]|uniref:Acetylxylan esterase n=1 Tax=Gimesia algae TaxID=2527971 RepID=A0A517V8V2_9PLAN|nr:alpha/beta hydrolase [Gimesia algae]QDT89418.1 Acetylxylan esterase precursor [Gimesia algae]